MNKTKFESICRMTQKAVKKYVTKELSENYLDVISADGYVYAQGDFPVLLVAHMDTVHTALPDRIIYDKSKGSISSPNGIGGDDRCGIYMILEIIKKYNCSVLFTEDEEIGCLGAEKFVESDLARELSFNYIIEFDRANKNDAVFYNCDNPKFETFITEKFYKTAYGSFSDISVIAPYLGCAAVNLSCGYYKAHTKDEYVVLHEVDNSIRAACAILERTTEDDAFEYIEAKSYYNKYYGRGYDCYGDYYGDYYDNYNPYYQYTIRYKEYDDNIRTVYYGASSITEAIGKFVMAHQTIPYKNIISVVSGGRALCGY